MATTNLNEYVGRSFSVHLEELDGAIGGLIAVDPYGNPLHPSLDQIPVLLGKAGSETKLPGFRTGKHLIRITERESTGLLFASLNQRPLTEIKENIEALVSCTAQSTSPQEVEALASPLADELAGYVCFDQKQIEIISRYGRKLTEIKTEAIRKVCERLRIGELEARFTSDLVIVNGAAEYVESARKMASKFLSATSKIVFAHATKDLQVRFDETRIGLIDGKPVAMLSYEYRPISGGLGISYLDNIGLQEVNPNFTKLFLTKAVSTLPHGKAFVMLWQHAFHDFFRQSGFVEGEYTYIVKKNNGGKADVHHAYHFRE